MLVDRSVQNYREAISNERVEVSGKRNLYLQGVSSAWKQPDTSHGRFPRSNLPQLVPFRHPTDSHHPKALPLLTNTFFWLLVPGGHKEFHRRHRELCEDTLLPAGGAGPSTVSGCPSPGPGCPVLSLSGPPTPQPADIDSHPASRVLPFLYLGNGRDAADLQLLRALGATRVLNVTSQLPGYHEERGITYRQIPASDSGHQNLKQYFEEAFDFIGKRTLSFFDYYFIFERATPIDKTGKTRIP